MPTIQFTVRSATEADCDGIAKVHVASIRSLGAKAYDSDIVRDWSASLSGDIYADAMKRGILFFIALVSVGEGDERVAGFSSYTFTSAKHRIAVYVDGDFARHGLGRALFTAAERAARNSAAGQIDIDASIGAVPFYKAMGFEELGRGEHQLGTGRKMICAFMRKRL